MAFRWVLNIILIILLCAEPVLIGASPDPTFPKNLMEKVSGTDLDLGVSIAGLFTRSYKTAISVQMHIRVSQKKNTSSSVQAHQLTCGSSQGQ